MQRFAVYLAPDPDSPLWRFGSQTLGYDANTGSELRAPEFAGFDRATWHTATRDPRTYGFHGTLKAPFRLKPGLTPAILIAALEALARAHHPFELPQLQVEALGPFIALVPSGPVPALMEIAERAVIDLDPLRAPLTPEEIARRRPDRLSARQKAMLDAYGYPHVLDQFRFHMTLTGPLQEPARGRALAALREAYGASGANVPHTFTSLALYHQGRPDHFFKIVHRAALGPSLERAAQ